MTDTHLPHVREATPDDAAALAAAYRSAYRENRRLGFPMTAESATADDAEAWIRADTVLVAELGDDVVGGVRLQATSSDRVKLSRLAVREDEKGRGIGRLLLDTAEETVRDRSDTIWLTTPPGHPFLPAFYRDHGYEKTDDHPVEYRDYDEIVMEKRLR